MNKGCTEKIFVKGICVGLMDCDCWIYDGRDVTDEPNKYPPFHKGCTCVIIKTPNKEYKNG